MRAIDVRFLMALLIVAGLPGCAGNRAPDGWRVPAAAAQRTSHGGWIIAELVGSPRPASGVRPVVQGELIAVDDTAFQILTSAGLQSVPPGSIEKMTLVAYSPSAGAFAAWAAAGGASTLSHGALLILTAPMWAAAGIAIVTSERRAGTIRRKELARPFARFPQGLPPNFDPASLGPLPTVPRK